MQINYARIIGQNLRYYRLLRKLTQKELAEITQTSPSTISSLECGHRVSSLKFCINLANTLHVELSVLFSRQMNRKIKKYDFIRHGMKKHA